MILGSETESVTWHKHSQVSFVEGHRGVSRSMNLRAKEKELQLMTSQQGPDSTAHGVLMLTAEHGHRSLWLTSTAADKTCLGHSSVSCWR